MSMAPIHLGGDIETPTENYKDNVQSNNSDAMRSGMKCRS